MDDDPMAVFMLGQLIRGFYEGCVVHPFEDPSLLLNNLDETETGDQEFPQLIFVDGHFPFFSQREVREKFLSKIEKYSKHIRVVVMSEYPDAELEETINNHPVVDSGFVKPVTSVLLSKLLGPDFSVNGSY